MRQSAKLTDVVLTRVLALDMPHTQALKFEDKLPFVSEATKTMLQDLTNKRNTVMLAANSGPQLRVTAIEQYLPALFGLQTAVAALAPRKVNVAFPWTSAISPTNSVVADFNGEFVFVLTLLALAHRNAAAELHKAGAETKDIVAHLRKSGGIHGAIADRYVGRWEGAAACACPESRADAHKMLQHLCAAEAQLLVAAKAARLGLQVKLLKGAHVRLADAVDALSALRTASKGNTLAGPGTAALINYVPLMSIVTHAYCCKRRAALAYDGEGGGGARSAGVAIAFASVALAMVTVEPTRDAVDLPEIRPINAYRIALMHDLSGLVDEWTKENRMIYMQKVPREHELPALEALALAAADALPFVAPEPAPVTIVVDESSCVVL